VAIHKDAMILILWAGLLSGLFAQRFSPQALPAFPGAEGFGACTPGGRGGQVILVTNLKDSGPGSLRAACVARGPRMVVFQVGGIIKLDSTLVIREPYITLAGQTAPGDGICIANYGAVVRTHDVVIRYLRFRPGDVAGKEQDALSVYQGQNVIIDHCSASWGTDETLSVTGGGADKVTVQWCFITESLNASVHHKGPHGYGSLLRVDGDLSFHHNLYASHNSRNPRPGAYGDMNRGSLLDFRNNVVYNWGTQPGYSAADKVSMNYVGNYLKPGPATPADRRYAFRVGGLTTAIYAADNHLEGNPGGTEGAWPLIALPDGITQGQVRLPASLEVAPISQDTPIEAYRRVLDDAGATLPRRDAVDRRVAALVQAGKGHIIDSQNDVGGWPRYRSGKPPKDSDSDGMPDDWEQAHGLNPSDGSDHALDADGDGYTNIEDYVNGMAP